MFSFFFSASFCFDQTWCEPPHWSYTTPGDADLIQVQVLTRHGARTPLHSPNNDQNIWMCKNTEYKQYSHPESHPLKINVAYGKSIFGGDCLFGQLLDEGSFALKRFGKFLRKTYVDQMKLLPAEYADDVCSFRSTSTHRTIHSCMSLIQGLYPEHPQITINVADKELDPFRRSSLVCPNLKKRIDDIKESPEFEKQYESNMTKMKEVAKLLGVKLSVSYDIVMASRCNNVSLYADVDSKILDEGSTLKAKQQISVFSGENVYPLVFSFAFTEILNTFIARINGNSSLKFKHWSGHNGNIFGFLAYLGEGLDKGPPYGSYIISELWKRKNGDFFVRFNYNGKILSPPRIGKGENILLSDLIQFTKTHMPELNKDCGFNPEKVKQSTVNRPEDK